MSIKKLLELTWQKELNTSDNKMIAKFKFVDSKIDILIQLADMVSGAIYKSYYPEKKDAFIYRNILKSRIKNIWEFK